MHCKRAGTLQDSFCVPIVQRHREVSRRHFTAERCTLEPSEQRCRAWTRIPDVSSQKTLSAAMRIRANIYGCSAPNRRVEPAHVSPIPTIVVPAVPAVPPVPKPLLYGTTYRSTSDYSSPAGRRNYVDGRALQSSEQGSDVWTTTANESEDIWYQDWPMGDVDAGTANEESCLNGDGLELQAVEFCDTTYPPSLWYPDMTMTAPYTTIDPAHVAILPSFRDSPTSSTFGDTTHGFDEIFAPMGEDPDILRKSAH
jgi:hypothetical protein